MLLIIFGESGQAYNVANEKSHLTIVQMAEMVLKKFGNRNAKVVFDIPEDSMKYGYAPSTKMHLSAKKIENIKIKEDMVISNNLLFCMGVIK